MMNEEFYRGYKEGFKNELKRLGIYKIFHRLVKEADETNYQSALARIKQKQATLQKKIAEIRPALAAIGYTDEEIKQEAIKALERGKQRGSLPKTNYFSNNGYEDSDDVEETPAVQQKEQEPKAKKKYIMTEWQRERLKQNIAELHNENLRSILTRFSKELVEKNTPQEKIKAVEDFLETAYRGYASDDSLFASFATKIDGTYTERRIQCFLNSLQVILEVVTEGEIDRQVIAKTINSFNKKYNDRIGEYFKYLRDSENRKIMNSVFKTHSNFNPADQKRGGGITLFAWMGKVGKVAEMIERDVQNKQTGGEISDNTVGALFQVIEQAVELIHRYESFRQMERESAEKGRFRKETKYDEEGKPILARNSAGQILIGSGSFPFYPSFIEFFLRGTIKKASGTTPTIIDKILLISDAEIPLLDDETRTEDEVFERMREIASKFVKNRLMLTQFTKLNGAFAGREVPKFYARIKDAYEKGKSEHGEMLEFVTMFANWLASKSPEDSDICLNDYNIDSIRYYIKIWTDNYNFFIEQTHAQKVTGQVNAMTGRMTDGTKVTTAMSHINAPAYQKRYQDKLNMRKKKKG